MATKTAPGTVRTGYRALPFNRRSIAPFGGALQKPQEERRPALLACANKGGLWREDDMPRMDWENFQDAHYRPHLVIATLQREARDTPVNLVTMFDRLATALAVTGNYAFKSDGASIRAAFELETDAQRFAHMLDGKTSGRDAEWASRTVGRIDSEAQKRIVSALRGLRLKGRKRFPADR